MLTQGDRSYQSQTGTEAEVSMIFSQKMLLRFAWKTAKLMSPKIVD
jgi:hypothetical protein